MEQYHIITVKSQDGPSDLNRTTTMVIDECPFEWLLSLKSNPKRQTVLIFTARITKQQYETWGEDEQTIYEQGI